MLGEGNSHGEKLSINFLNFQTDFMICPLECPERLMVEGCAIRHVPLILARDLNTLPLRQNISEASNQYSEYTRDPNTVAPYTNVLEAEIIQMALNTVDPDRKDFTGVGIYTNKKTSGDN